MNVFEAAADAWRTGRRAALATVIAKEGSAPRSAGARMLVYEDGGIVGTIGGGELERRVIVRAIEVIAAGQPDRMQVHLTRDLGMCCGGQMEVYVEPLSVREPFVVYGAGHVARALAPLLVALDFAVTIVDERDDYATADRFPGCDVRAQDPIAHAMASPGGPDAWILIVTHDHGLDQALCETLLPKTSAWIGMIGSRAKVAKFAIRLRGAGMSEAELGRLCAPVGLDVGAETPAEIAVSIAAEIVRVRRGVDRPAVPLSAIPLPARGGDGVARSGRSTGG